MTSEGDTFDIILQASQPGFWHVSHPGGGGRLVETPELVDAIDNVWRACNAGHPMVLFDRQADCPVCTKPCALAEGSSASDEAKMRCIGEAASQIPGAHP